jgi:hypothetical protein
MYKTQRFIFRTTLFAILFIAVWVNPTYAQRRLPVEAYAGQPFGVGRITIDLSQDMLPDPLGAEGIGLTEQNGRALYPAIDNPAFGRVVKDVLDAVPPLTSGGPVRQEVGGILRKILDKPPPVTLYFLFQGNEPLDLSLQTRRPIPIRIVPRNNPMLHQRLLQQWWKQYARPAGLFESKPDYPPLVDNYLMSSLARRLNLRIPEQKQTKSAYAELRHEMGLNLGTESLRMSMMQDRILGLNNLAQPADQPLPEPLPPPPLEVPEPAANVKIEAIAKRVPVECFYARFGSFANFLWLQDTLAKWGGDAQNLISLRGLDLGLSRRMETQLVMKQTALSRMLGNTVISDVAIIGTDMFFREGASYGILFQARNNLALSASLNQQRQERIAAGGVSEKKIKIGEKTVSYLTSPDGKVRSYYVNDGDFHFITTSKKLVERFLTTASGVGALGTSAEFQHARTLMPIDRNDTIWFYVSDSFFSNMTSPHYRIEMARRLQAASDIQLVQLAALAAKCEGKPGGTIEEMKSSGLLPPEFGPLPDGSRIVLDDGAPHDNMRGWLGAFLPISDMPIGMVTQAERSEYMKFIDYYQSQWGRMDPVVAGIRRTALKDNREQVVVDILMSPLAPKHFALLRQRLGEPDPLQLAPIPGDMAAIDLALDRQRVFGALRDVGRPSNAYMASWLPIGRLRDFLVGYIGTTGELGVLNILNLGIPPYSDPQGYAGSPIGGWRRQFESVPTGTDIPPCRFTVFSFQREILEEIAPQLRFEKAQRPAQVRLHVEDVSQARITPALNDLGFARTRETSLGNLRLLHALDQQLHVAPKACKDTAESMLDAKLICPLGGQYVLRDEQGESPGWTSTALRPVEQAGLFRIRAPEGYQSPPLSWFRGLDLDAIMTEKSISAHAEVIMQMPSAK